MKTILLPLIIATSISYTYSMEKDGDWACIATYNRPISNKAQESMSLYMLKSSSAESLRAPVDKPKKKSKNKKALQQESKINEF